VLIAAADVLKSLGHAGFEKFGLEFDLPVGAVQGSTLKERANSLAQYLLGRSVEPIVAGIDGEVVERAKAQIKRFGSALPNVSADESQTFQEALTQELLDTREAADVDQSDMVTEATRMANHPEWISAADAVSMLRPVLTTYSAQMRICERAFVGMIRARAEQYHRDTEVFTDCEIPKEFWWAKGHQALEQDWAVGDFSTWIDKRIELKAFGVQFARPDVEKLIPAAKSTTGSKADRADEALSASALQRIVGRRVFVVHGRDEAMRDKVVNALFKAKCQPIVLGEQVDAGQTIIEKIEKYGDVDFAVVLLSPDDFGGLHGEAAKPRARQNVLLELGYFFGRLRRNRLAILMKDDVEFPSDFAGVVWKSFDAAGGWRTWLVRELDAAGIPIDWPDFHS
jgi:predicted nucleotide-binding protein